MPFTDAGTYPVSGIYTENIMSLHDVFKPQHIPTLFSRFEEQYMPTFSFLRGLGREMPVANDTWYAHEENWYNRVILTTGSVADPGAGNAATLTLASSDHDSKGNSFPRVGDIVSIPGTYVQARIMSKDTSTPSAHTITIKPIRAADNIGAISSGTTISITNYAKAAGMGQPAGTVVGTTKRTFQAQIFAETIGAEGSQLVNERWYKVTDNNKNVVGWYSPGYMRGEYFMALRMDGAFWWGVESDNWTETTHTGSTNDGKTTKGVFPWVKELGKQLTYTSGSFGITDLREVGLYLKSQGVTSGVVILFVGTKFHHELEDATKDYVDGNGTDFTRVEKTVFKGNRELSLSMNITVITIGGITFIIKPMDAWSNPTTFGATGYDLDEYALWMPLSKYKDPESGKLTNNIEYRYRAMGNYSRRYETWRVAGAGGGLYVSEIDEENTYFRSHMGLQFVKVNQCGLYKPA